MKILVTGGAGFLGTNLVIDLLRQGHSVDVIDNECTSELVDLTGNVVDVFGDKSGLRVWDVDVKDPTWVTDDYFMETDVVYHLACPASPPMYQRNHLDTLMTAFMGTKRVLEFAGLRNVPMLFTSTSEIYGDPEVSPQPETYWGKVNSYGPRSCYDCGKRAAEALCYAYTKEVGVDVRIARLFNTYGPHMASNDGRVVSNFIMQALRGESITVYGQGQQVRSLCYVDDTIAGIQAIMHKRPLESTVSIFNIGNPEPITMMDLAKEIISLTGTDSEIIYQAMPIDDPQTRCPDIMRAKTILDWQPRVGRTEGLKKTVEYFRRFV